MAHHQEEPATTIIRFLGGAQIVADIVDKHPSRIYRWTASEDVREGTGGLVPAKDQRRLLEYAQAHGIDLRPEDFFSPGRLQALLPEAPRHPQRSGARTPSRVPASNGAA